MSVPLHWCCLQYVPAPKPVMAPTHKDLQPLLQQQAGAAAAAPASGKLTKAEERAVGRVDRAVYGAYFRQGKLQMP